MKNGLLQLKLKLGNTQSQNQVTAEKLKPCRVELAFTNILMMPVQCH